MLRKILVVLTLHQDQSTRDRTKELIENIKEFEKTLPMKRLGEPEEIGNFVKAIVENKIKYLSGVTINFDGANSNYIF